MSTDDQARMIAERIARRLNQSRTDTAISDPGSNVPNESAGSEVADRTSLARPLQRGPLGEELSAIRAGLHALENKIEHIESSLRNAPAQSFESPRARVIDFLSPTPPTRTAPLIDARSRSDSLTSDKGARNQFVPTTQSPWLGSFARTTTAPASATESFNSDIVSGPPVESHPSQERFGVEEAAVSELVEFFENEKKCSVDPSGKPCDHCAMCSGRGF